MFAAEHNIKNIVNFLSLRVHNLDIEDSQGVTLLMHMTFQNNFKMVSWLMRRGANMDFVSSRGKTVLHACIERQQINAIEYLLYKKANTHILDFDERDCCDKAKENKLALQFKIFCNCNLRKKCIAPNIPDYIL
jgi:ankyrin repeat protein